MNKEEIKKLIGSCVYNYCGPRYEDIGLNRVAYKFFTKLGMHYESITANVSNKSAFRTCSNAKQYSLCRINGIVFEFNWDQFMGSTIKLNNEIILKAQEHSIEISDTFVNYINNNI